MSRQPARSVSWTAAAAVRALLEPAARIESVARRLGITRQHLRRIVLAETGLTPKLLARLSRFRAAFEHSMQEHNGPNWPDTAAAFGYSDQSHLIAEFRRFAGRPPSDLPRW
jgi:methylphosphotriester-DNA--protein-cysteine methyltransferase